MVCLQGKVDWWGWIFSFVPQSPNVWIITGWLLFLWLDEGKRVDIKEAVEVRTFCEGKTKHQGALLRMIAKLYTVPSFIITHWLERHTTTRRVAHGTVWHLHIRIPSSLPADDGGLWIFIWTTSRKKKRSPFIIQCHRSFLLSNNNTHLHFKPMVHRVTSLWKRLAAVSHLCPLRQRWEAVN